MQRFLIVGLLVAVLVFFGVRSFIDDATGWDRRVDRGFKRVRAGMSKHEVQSLMRSQGERLEQFRIGQEGGFEKQYSEAAASKSSYWLSWRNGIDYRYTVGFDQNDRVTYQASGGT